MTAKTNKSTKATKATPKKKPRIAPELELAEVKTLVKMGERMKAHFEEAE